MTLLASLPMVPALAADITGKAEVIDGGTIEIGGRRIRLFGLEAPEGSQTCTSGGQDWNCGQQATWALAYELAEHWVTCRNAGAQSPQYVTAVCYIGGTQDVGERMVRKGWAHADRYASQNYVAAETEARRTRVGLWQGDAR